MEHSSLEHEFKSNAEKLKLYAEQGFLFHGSPENDLIVLEPREASDLDVNKTFNADMAVFATDIPSAAVLFSVVGNFPENVSAGNWSVDLSADKINVVAKIPAVWKEYVENQSGSVYILNKESFDEKEDAQWKSHSNVVPQDKVPVHLNDYFELGGKIEWIK